MDCVIFDFVLRGLRLIETLGKALEHNFAKLAEGLSAKAAATKRLHWKLFSMPVEAAYRQERRAEKRKEKKKGGQRGRGMAERIETREHAEKRDKIWKSAVSISRGNPLRFTSSSQSHPFLSLFILSLLNSSSPLLSSRSLSLFYDCSHDQIN